ncbi:putative ABC transport system permease protein [Stackebrandtia albiflava]|uniref:Putative ABC transport system permease protein n=1 Tax=Stackebrandtia albiflava TaxID=406432 RepID=A0A562UL50_9ACTN|nr:ABC transporter permease [Stackebrandtia albiflava]TWJ06343.1 putative ABC transport system permease protein [Stackebrandtia albiflava]
MLRATFKSLLSRKARLLLSTIAVVLGVAFVTGSLVLNSSLGKSIESMFTTVFDDVDVQVTAERDDSLFASATPIPADVVERVAGVDGVSEATGLVSEGTGKLRVVGKNGKAIPNFGAPVIGQNFTGFEDPMELKEGTEPQADDEVAVSASLVATTGYELGDTLPLLTDGPEAREFEIVGVFGYSGGRDSVAGEQTILFTLEAARANLMTVPDAYTLIDVTAESGTDDSQLRDDIADLLGSGYVVQTGEDLAAEQTEAFQPFLDVFNYLLLGFGAVALIVSVFLIVNTFSIIVAQRTRELALFRALGAGRGQVTGAVLLEALIVGLLSAVVGLLLGIGVGYLGTVALGSSMGTDMEATLVVPWQTILAALLIGVGVTMLAALIPAVGASRIPPMAALREAANTIKPVRWFAIIGGILLALGAVALFLGLTERVGDGDDSLLLVLAGVGLLFIGLAVVIPAIAKPLVSLIGAVLSWSMPGKLGRRNSSRNPRRTAITASALMIGITLVTAVGVVLSSANASIQKFFAESVSADVMIAGVGTLNDSYNVEILDEVREMPEVSQAAAAYIDQAEFVEPGTNDEAAVLVEATDDVTAYTELLGITVSEGDLSDLDRNGLVVYKGWAEQHRVTVGDTVDLRFSAAESAAPLTVVAVVESSIGGEVMVSDDHVDRFGQPDPMQAYITLEDGADKPQVIERINQLLAENPAVTAADIGVLNDQLTVTFDAVLLVVQVLLSLAIFIAVIGVVNTLTLSVLERTRELGLLRAVGMTRGQVTAMVMVESVVISVFGAVLGLAAGAGLGIVVQQALSDDFLEVLVMPWGTMVFYLVAAVVIGVLASLIPAFRANRLNVLSAISHD